MLSSSAFYYLTKLCITSATSYCCSRDKNISLSPVRRTWQKVGYRPDPAALLVHLHGLPLLQVLLLLHPQYRVLLLLDIFQHQ